MTADDDLLVIDARSDGTHWSTLALRTLASLPCLVVSEPRPDSPTVHLDAIALDGVTGIDQLIGRIEANPGAALALALLQRGADRRTVADGLIAESATYSMLQAGPEFTAWLTGRADRSPGRRPESTDQPIMTQRNGRHLTITLDRPEVRNALDTTMRHALLDALTVATTDPTVETVTIVGAGPDFCSGGDLDEFGTAPDPVSAHRIRLATSVGRILASIGSRIEVHVHGACRGSGVELAAFAGRVVAHPDTTFALPEVAMGLIPGAGGTVSITRRVGRLRASSLAMSGAVIDAPTALGWGLVDVVEP